VSARGASNATLSLCGTAVRADGVKLLAGMLPPGDELAEKLNRALANENTIVALSMDERQRLVDALETRPSWLVNLRKTLDAQVKKHKDRQAQDRRLMHDRQRIERRRAVGDDTPATK
jgi:hypothetical protein